MALGFTVIILLLPLASPAQADTGDPTAISAQSENLNIAVSWDAVSASGVDGYVVTTSPESPEVTVPAGARSAVLTGVRPNVSYQVSVAAVRDGVPGEAASTDQDVSFDAPGGSFVGTTPFRLLDTRIGLGAPTGATTAVTVQVAGTGGLPTDNISAVALNVTVTGSTAGGYVTVYPSDVARPTASNVNYTKGQTRANLVITPVGADGQVKLYSSAKTHLIADVSGYFSTVAEASPTAGLFHPIQPARLMDTRNGVGASTPGPRGQVKIKVTGTGGVPQDNVSAVVLNTTVAKPTATGYVTAYPTGQDRPNSSTLNFVSNQTVANRVIVPVGDDGSVNFFNSAGKTPLVVDVGGWFTAADDDSASGSYFVPVEPTRLVDTRIGLGAAKAKLGAQATLAVAVAGGHSVPSIGLRTPPTAAVTTVTAVKPTVSTYATVFPSLNARPAASDLNAAANSTVPNLSLAGLGSDGKVAVYNNSGSTDFVVDLSGYFIGNVHVPDSTLVIKKSDLVDVSGDPATDATLTLATDAPQVQIGQVITTGPGSESPAGLLVKIISVRTNTQGQQVVQTAPATLSEAIGSGDLSISIPLRGSDVIAAQGIAAPRAKGRAKTLDLREIARRQVTAKAAADPVGGVKSKINCSADADSYVETEFSLEPTLNLEAHLGWSGFHPTIRAKAYAQIKESASAGFGFEGKASCTWQQQLAKFIFPTITVPVAGVPVVILPELTVKLDAQISGQAKISSSVSQDFTAKAGVEYDGKSTKPIQELSNTLSFQPLALTEAKGSASVALISELIGKIYGIAGPTITLTAKLSATVDPLHTPLWALVFDLTAKAGLHLDVSIINITIETDEFTLLHKILAQAGGNPNPTAAVDLVFDDFPVGTLITNAYQTYGVVFGGDETPYISNDGSNPTAPVLSGGGGFGTTLHADFVNPDGSPRNVSTFTVDVGYIDQPGSTEILAYDINGTLLQTAVADSEGIDTLTLSRSGIHSFVVRSTGIEDNGWAIDNLNFAGFAGAPTVTAAKAHRQAVPRQSTTKG